MKYLSPYLKRGRDWLMTLGFTYLALVGGLYLFQQKLMYRPDATLFEPSAWALQELKPMEVKTQDGLTLSSWRVAPHAPDKFTIVYFQGNAGSVGLRNYKARSWIDAGYGVLLIGYRGYNGNSGIPNEQGLYEDARASLREAIKQGMPESGFVLYGESLGTGIAAQMATEFQNVASLILESPYTSMADVGAWYYPYMPAHWLVRDRYDSLAKIADVHAPLLLLHGEADRVVPTKMGRKLFAAANEPKQAVFISQAGHGNVYNMDVQQKVLQFIGQLPTAHLLDQTAS